MKKSHLALALLGAFAGVAQAQTSVTVYGSFDAGVRYQSDVNDKGNSRLSMGSTGTFQSNRIGFKGIEELGGGLNAHFTLESGFNSGTGALNNTNNQLFERSAFVGLGGQWGALDLGRQFTVAFKTAAVYDPFNSKYSGITPIQQSSISAGTRVNNDIQYTGTFGPITARAEWALGEQAGSARNASQQAVGVSYANGPLALGGAYTLRKPNVAAPSATANYQDNRDWTLGGAYTFGPARIALGYAKETQDQIVNASTQQKNAWIGGSYELTPVLGLTAAYYNTKVDTSVSATTGKRDLFVIGSTYKLSKRTNLYADLDYARYKDGLVGGSATVTSTGVPLNSANGQSHLAGVSVGVNHIF